MDDGTEFEITGNATWSKREPKRQNHARDSKLVEQDACKVSGMQGNTAMYQQFTVTIFELSLINLLHLLQNDCTLFRYLCTTMYRVWKNTGVNAYVVLVVGCTGKRLATSGHITRVRSLSSVRADVNFTYVRRGKRSAASRVWTHKRLLSCSTWILHYNELLSPKTTCRYNFVHKYIT